MKLLIFFVFLFSYNHLIAQSLSVVIPESRCSSIDIREGMNPAMKKHFSTPRDQGRVGWCYGFVTADILSAHSNQAISAIHVSSLYNKYLSQNYFRKLIYSFTEAGIKRHLNTIIEGGLMHKALEDSMREKFLCLERDLPYSENFLSGTLRALKEIETLKAQIKNGGDIESHCSSLKNIRAGLFNELGVNQIFDILKKMELNQALAKLSSAHCIQKSIPIKKNEVVTLNKVKLNRDRRIPYSERLVKAGNKIDEFFMKIEQALSSGKPMGISYNTSNVSDRDIYHASLVVARRWMGGKCQFKIRDSFGESCHLYDENKIEQCHESEGSFWVSDQVFYNMADRIDYLK